MFIIDSQALSRSINLIKKVEPDFVEVLPGIAHKVVKIIDEETPSKVIAGGLINEESEIVQALDSGAVTLQQAIACYGS